MADGFEVVDQQVQALEHRVSVGFVEHMSGAVPGGASRSSLADAFNRRLSVNPSDHSTLKPSRSLGEKGLLAEDYSSDLPTN